MVVAEEEHLINELMSEGMQYLFISLAILVKTPLVNSKKETRGSAAFLEGVQLTVHGGNVLVHAHRCAL